MMNGEIPPVSSREVPGALFMQAPDVVSSKSARYPPIEKTSKERVQPVFFIGARCIGLRNENIAPGKQAQLVRTIAYGKRSLADLWIDSIEKRELAEHQSRLFWFGLQHLFSKVVEDVQL